jgi:hypothetical protein
MTRLAKLLALAAFLQLVPIVGAILIGVEPKRVFDVAQMAALVVFIGYIWTSTMATRYELYEKMFTGTTTGEGSSIALAASTAAMAGYFTPSIALAFAVGATTQDLTPLALFAVLMFVMPLWAAHDDRRAGITAPLPVRWFLGFPLGRLVGEMAAFWMLAHPSEALVTSAHERAVSLFGASVSSSMLAAAALLIPVLVSGATKLMLEIKYGHRPS